MAENSVSAGTQLPPPPTNAGAPGYENGHSLATHMPPPPLAIPQNTNPIPTAVTSPLGGGDLSAEATGGFVRRAAPEPNKRALYVGGLDPRVTEDVLRQIFETTGHVQNVKIIPDKNVGAVSLPSSLIKILSSVLSQISPSALLKNNGICGRCSEAAYELFIYHICKH